MNKIVRLVHTAESLGCITTQSAVCYDSENNDEEILLVDLPKSTLFKIIEEEIEDGERYYRLYPIDKRYSIADGPDGQNYDALYYTGSWVKSKYTVDASTRLKRRRNETS